MFNVGSGKAMSVLAYAHAVLKKLSSRVTLEMSGEYRRGDNWGNVRVSKSYGAWDGSPAVLFPLFWTTSPNGSTASAEYPNKSRMLTPICAMPAWC